MTHTETALVFTDTIGHRVAGLLAIPPSPTDKIVILCHGFLSDKNSRTNTRLTELFLSNNIATFRFDWFGRGESDGDFADITTSICCDQLHHAARVVRTHGYRRIGLVGSSFGGFVALLAAAHIPDILALGLKCPVPDFPEMLKLRFGEALITTWKETGTMLVPLAKNALSVRLHYRFYEDSLAHHAYQAARAFTRPVFIVHGDQDAVVPFHQIQELTHSLSGDRCLLLLAGADHQFARPNDFRKMTAALAEWLTRTMESSR